MKFETNSDSTSKNIREFFKGSIPKQVISVKTSFKKTEPGGGCPEELKLVGNRLRKDKRSTIQYSLTHNLWKSEDLMVLLASIF